MTSENNTHEHENGTSTFYLSLFHNKFDADPQLVERTWEYTCARIASPQVRADKDGPLFSPATFSPPQRLKKNVQAISQLVLDYDHDADFDRDMEVWREMGLAFAAYTTHSSYRATESNPNAEERFRAIVPLLEPIPAIEFLKLWRWAAERSGGKIDPQAKDTSRMFYTPAIPEENARYRYEIHAGALLDWRALSLKEDEKPQKQAPSRNGRAQGDAYVRKALEGEVGKVATASIGDRNTQLNASAFALGQLVGGGALTRFDVEDALMRAASSAGLGEQEIKQTIKSGIEAGLKEPRAIPEPKPQRKTSTLKTEQANGSVLAPDEAEPADEIETVFDDEDLQADFGNTARFLNAYRATTRYIYARKKFMCFDGKRWSDDQGIVEDRASRTVQLLRLTKAQTLDAQEKAFKHYIKSQSPERRNAILTLARAEIRIEFEAFDADPELFNVSNGTIHLPTGELRPHDPRDYCSKMSKVKFDPHAECPLWLEFLQGIFKNDQDLIDFIQRATGYSLSGLTYEQVLFLLYGIGKNGKTTFVNVLARLTGGYAASAQMDVFAAHNRAGNGHNEDLANLRGARLVTAIETEESKRLSESLIKQITGCDPVTASRKHEHSFTYTPVLKLWLAANHKPVIRGTDDGIWRRPLLVPFLVQFEVDPSKRKEGEREADPKLESKLLGELPGILNWALEGFRHWNDKGLRPPDSVRTATQKYREESDLLGAFIEERLIQGHRVGQKGEGATPIYQEYRDWCEKNGERPITQTTFGLNMTERGFTKKKDGKRMVYNDLFLASPEILISDSSDSSDSSSGFFST